jgi:hypothetical protein
MPQHMPIGVETQSKKSVVIWFLRISASQAMPVTKRHPLDITAATAQKASQGKTRNRRMWLDGGTKHPPRWGSMGMPESRVTLSILGMSFFS